MVKNPDHAEPSAANNETAAAYETLKRYLRDDPDYAWGWHCNLAMPIMDATGVSAQKANQAAAYLMFHVFGCDITTHPNYTSGKSPAHEYHEMRIAAEREEDTATAGETRSEAEGIAQPLPPSGYSP